MPTYKVYGLVTGSLNLGEVEAINEEEAKKLRSKVMPIIWKYHAGLTLKLTI